MGAITIQVGALTRSISAADGPMGDVLLEVVEATNGPVAGTNTQKADWVLGIVRSFLMDVSNGHRRTKAAEVAQANAVVITI